MMSIARFQVGKNGITDGVIDALTLLYKNHKQVRISLLKSSGRNRESIDAMAKDLMNKLSLALKCEFHYKIIGFTIVMMKVIK